MLALGDRVVIQVVSGSSAVGRYQVAYAVGALGVALLSALQNAWVPITFSASDEERWEALAKMTAIVVRLGILAAVGITVVAPIALDVLAPASYDPSDLVTVTALVAAGAVPWAFYLPMSQVLFWQRRTRPLAWITPLSAIFNLALVALLVPPLGLAGAGLSTLLALMLQAFLCSRAAAAAATVPWAFRRLVVPLIAGTVALAAFTDLPSGPLLARSACGCSCGHRTRMPASSPCRNGARTDSSPSAVITTRAGPMPERTSAGFSDPEGLSRLGNTSRRSRSRDPMGHPPVRID